MNPQRALFIQLRRIGDILMCTPAIRALKKHFPNCQLDFLTEIPDVLKGNPYIDSIISVYPAREYNFRYQFELIRKIHANHYDLVVDFFANPRSAYYSFLCGAKTRLSYGYGHRRWAYNLVPDKSEEPSYAAIERLNLLKAIDIPSDGPRLEFYPTNDDRSQADQLYQKKNNRPIVTLSPVSRRQFNRWPLENYARLADLFVKLFDANVLVVAGPGEESVAKKVVSLCKAKVYTPSISNLGALGAIFERSSLHIGNDNGPKHIAVACGAPTITVYGPHSPLSWTYPDATHHDWVGPTAICDDCHNKKHRCDSKCIKSISVENVWEKALKMTSLLPIFCSMQRKA